MRKRYQNFKKYILGTNWLKTIRINLYYFDLLQAVRFPILVSRRVVFQQLEGGVEIDAPIKTGMLLLGYHGLGSQDYFYERTVWQVSGTVRLGGSKISIGGGSRFCVSGLCYLGDHFMISGRSTVICHHNIQFGNKALLSWDILVMDTDYHKILDLSGQIINQDKSIIIGDKVWVGCRSTILKGSVIPHNSIIAAGSIISGKLEKENSIYTSDKRLLKDNIYWEA